jgi:hypothetical protein
MLDELTQRISYDLTLSVTTDNKESFKQNIKYLHSFYRKNFLSSLVSDFN